MLQPHCDEDLGQVVPYSLAKDVEAKIIWPEHAAQTGD